PAPRARGSAANDSRAHRAAQTVVVPLPGEASRGISSTHPAAGGHAPGARAFPDGSGAAQPVPVGSGGVAAASRRVDLGAAATTAAGTEVDPARSERTLRGLHADREPPAVSPP